MKEMKVEVKFNKSIIVAVLMNKLQNTIQLFGSLIFGEPTMNSMIVETQSAQYPLSVDPF